MHLATRIAAIAAVFLQGMLLAAVNAAANDIEKSAFTGHIDAYYELRYAKFLSRENIVFTVDHDAIQRIVYAANDHYKGLVVYPLEKKVMFFRQAGALKFYTVLTLSEYESEIANYINQGSLDDYDRIGFSDHFLALIDAAPTQASSAPPAIHDNTLCKRNAWITAKLASDSIYTAEHCAHVAVPHHWLRYTDLNIPDQATSFPFSFTKRAMDNSATATSVFGDKVESDSTTHNWVNIAGRAVRKASRMIDELEEFTYKVVKLAPGPVKKADFINLLDFVRVDSLQALKESFPDHPNHASHSRSGGRSSSGVSDMFD